MQESVRRVLTGIIFFVVTVITAIFGYIWFGWTPLEAIYMVVITIFGVGYGEVKPLETPFQKIFTILVIIAGTTSAVYIVGGFVQMVMDAFEQRQRQSVEDLEQIYYVTAAIVAALENNTFRVDNLGLEEVADRSDELGALARAIQQMVDIIQKQDQEISTLKQQLTEED